MRVLQESNLLKECNDMTGLHAGCSLHNIFLQYQDLESVLSIFHIIASFCNLFATVVPQGGKSSHPSANIYFMTDACMHTQMLMRIQDPIIQITFFVLCLCSCWQPGIIGLFIDK